MEREYILTILQRTNQQCQRYPHALVNLAPDLVLPVCAIQVGDEWAAARNSTLTSDISTVAMMEAAMPTRCKVNDGESPGHGGVDDGIGHHRQLRRPSMGQARCTSSR